MVWVVEVTAGDGGDEVTSLGMVIVVSLNLASAMKMPVLLSS